MIAAKITICYTLGLIVEHMVILLQLMGPEAALLRLEREAMVHSPSLSSTELPSCIYQHAEFLVRNCDYVHFFAYWLSSLDGTPALSCRGYDGTPLSPSPGLRGPFSLVLNFLLARSL